MTPTSPPPASRPPLVRYLSKCNVASRPEARALVRAGRVQINGQRCVDGARRVHPVKDRVTVDGALVRLPEPHERLWLALNKPRGVVATTSDPEGRRTVMDLVSDHAVPGLAPVGRLDRASAGLLLLANDSDLAARLLDPAGHVPKVYRVKIAGHPRGSTLRAWREDAVEDGGLLLGPMDVEIEREGPKSVWLRIVLREGRNRQIRRRMRIAGHRVDHLIRVAFGPILLGELAPGEARALAPSEVLALRESVGG